ncbi:hypothetical protein HIM_12550 [Hirsutella minnesotensis 3608]|uniref:Reverse transcriptase zinc-binding domain-containing protein n=1 Tax=Hirsutella minnesotensis 3608 TaxID=1043627 RepID=A0A0F7ZQL2_9HYPO|nr:hypothetical protein HIM_12550 [Hirsutella minnesotensis 3608]
MMWMPAKTDDCPLGSQAKKAAKQATGRKAKLETETYRALSTIVRLAIAQHRQDKLPERVQLRTGMSRLNVFLHRIGAAESELCDCGKESEMMDHFLFRCARWEEERKKMLKSARDRLGGLSNFLGGKTSRDSEEWAPDKQAVRAAIKFAMATKRLAGSNTNERETKMTKPNTIH